MRQCLPNLDLKYIMEKGNFEITTGICSAPLGGLKNNQIPHPHYLGS